jgi:hypothetical protein
MRIIRGTGQRAQGSSGAGVSAFPLSYSARVRGSTPWAAPVDFSTIRPTPARVCAILQIIAMMR